MRDELYHYGIKGMRWGVRRNREKDGVSTSSKKKVAIGVGVAAGTAAVATGLYMKEYTSWSTYSARNINPTSVVNFPGAYVWFSNRVTRY